MSKPRACDTSCTQVAQGTQAPIILERILHPPQQAAPPRKTPGEEYPWRAPSFSRWPVSCVHAATAVRDHQHVRRVRVFVVVLCVSAFSICLLSERFSLSRVSIFTMISVCLYINLCGRLRMPLSTRQARPRHLASLMRQLFQPFQIPGLRSCFAPVASSTSLAQAH